MRGSEWKDVLLILGRLAGPSLDGNLELSGLALVSKTPSLGLGRENELADVVRDGESRGTAVGLVWVLSIMLDGC